MQTNTMTITPAKAAKYLENNTENRPIKNTHVAFLASEITNGNWKCNGESIKIGKNKIIIDGQHRLSAVVAAKKSIKTVVTTGLDNDVFDTIDTGVTRTGGDIFSLMGEKNCNNLAALLKAMHRYYDLDWKKATRISNTELEKLLERYPDARDIVCMGDLKSPGLLAPRVIHFCFAVFKRKNKEQALDFMVKLCHGNDLSARSPIMAVRNKIMDAKLKGSRFDSDLLITLIFKAWNLYRDGKTATRLTLKKGEQLERAH